VTGKRKISPTAEYPVPNQPRLSCNETDFKKPREREVRGGASSNVDMPRERVNTFSEGTRKRLPFTPRRRSVSIKDEKKMLQNQRKITTMLKEKVSVSEPGVQAMDKVE